MRAGRRKNKDDREEGEEEKEQNKEEEFKEGDQGSLDNTAQFGATSLRPN